MGRGEAGGHQDDKFAVLSRLKTKLRTTVPRQVGESDVIIPFFPSPLRSLELMKTPERGTGTTGQWRWYDSGRTRRGQPAAVELALVTGTGPQVEGWSSEIRRTSPHGLGAL